MPLLATAFLLLLVPCAPARAQASPASDGPVSELALPSIFGDHMVLQRGSEVAFFGRARPAADVRVLAPWLPEAVPARAGQDGRWRVDVPTPEAGGPFELAVVSGAETVRLKDVLVGEVWVCGGQSNMEFTLAPGIGSGAEGYQEALAQADLPRLRYFDVAHALSIHPLEDCQGHWSVSDPETAGGFSAVGFFFGRELLRELDCPIGLIGCNWGGTRAEAWTSSEGLAPLGDFDDELARILRARAHPEEVPTSAERWAAWWDGLGASEPGLAGGWFEPGFDGSGWQEQELPGGWEEHGLAGRDGTVWYRRSLEIPEEWAGRALVVELGPIDDQDITWLDGERIGGLRQPGAWRTPRRYPVAGLTAGRHVLAVCVLDTGGPGGFGGAPGDLAIGPEGSDSRISLAGSWRRSPGATLAELPPVPTEWLGPNTPTALSCGMLAPIVPYGIRGAIFYQGEANRMEAKLYQRLFPALIADWRARWGRGDFPFYYVQIAPFAYGGDTGQAGALRDAQRRALSVPNTGMVVTLDVGNPSDIHPRRKLEVGQRLARWALARTYGQSDLAVSGPLYRGMRVVGDTVLVSFDHTGGGLVARGGELSDFELLDQDGVWRPARAEIRGGEVAVTSEEVPRPVGVRYAWAAACQPNLFNGAGLPASTFTSED